MGYEINSYPYLRQDSLYNAYMYQFANQNVSNNAPMQYGYYKLQNSTPSFKAGYTNQPDTFSASNQLQQPKKEGMSTGTKWGIGAVIATGVGLGIWALNRGNGGTKSAQQLAKHIDFKPAKTIKEAKNFAQDKLGVKYVDDVEKFNDLSMVNFINEWMVKSHNNPKLGAESYPKIVYNTELDGAFMSMTTKKVVIDGVDYGYGLGVDLKHFKNFEPTELKKRNFDFGFIKKGTDGKYMITDSLFDNKYSKRIVKSLNSDNLTFKEKMQLALDMIARKESVIIDGKLQIRERGVYNYLNHEQGHMLHSKISNNYEQMKKVSEYTTNGKNVSTITQEFVTNKDIQKTAAKVSKYATESPLEFVAETFAGMRDGMKFDDDVMALYKKYGGPALS